MSRWKDIFDFLESKGYEVYPPATKKEECKSPYIVLKNAGRYDTNEVSSVYDVYCLLLYIPLQSYSILEDFKEKLKQDMIGLFPMIRDMHDESEPYYDDAVKAYMIELNYKNYKKKVRS